MTLDSNAKQRAYRHKNKDVVSKRYEKTLNGYRMRMYRNMLSRIKGIQYKKAHLYVGKELLSKEDFYNCIDNNDDYIRIFKEYERLGYPMKFAPSIDRIDPSIGYVLSNMRIITHSENSRLGSISKHKNKL